MAIDRLSPAPTSLQSEVSHKLLLALAIIALCDGLEKWLAELRVAGDRWSPAGEGKRAEPLGARAEIRWLVRQSISLEDWPRLSMARLYTRFVIHRFSAS